MASVATQSVAGNSFKQLEELLKTLVNQLTDKHLLRLWRTGAMITVVTAKDDEHTDLSPYVNGPEEYALSKDLDVALWIDFRAFHGKPELVNVIDFVIVNSRLHDEFDQFKKAEVQSSYSLLPVVELLLFYCLTKCPHVLDSSQVHKFGRTYIKMDSSQVDDLVSWVYEMNERYSVEGQDVFIPGIRQRGQPIDSEAKRQ